MLRADGQVGLHSGGSAQDHASDVRAASAAAPPYNTATVRIVFEGVDFDSLTADQTLRTGFRMSVKHALAELNPSIKEGDVAVEMFAGSVIMQVTITLPPGLDEAAIAHLTDRTALTNLIAQRIQNLPRLSSILTGAATVNVEEVTLTPGWRLPTSSRAPLS